MPANKDAAQPLLLGTDHTRRDRLKKAAKFSVPAVMSAAVIFGVFFMPGNSVELPINLADDESVIGIVVESNETECMLSGACFGACYQGKLDYVKECVAQRSPVGKAIYKNPRVLPDTTCKEHGYTKTNSLTNPDTYYGKHNNVSIWFVRIQQQRTFVQKMISNWPNLHCFTNKVQL